MFLVIDKSTQVMGMYELSNESYERGAYKVEQALEVYKTFFSENKKKDVKLHYLKEFI